VQLNELLREVDLVTLHVNLTDGNKGFFGAREFALMKEGAWFVNSSRGELVDERALLDSLTSGHLAGAALDVICGEHSTSLASHSLIAYARSHDNLIITPHIGGCTIESMDKSESFLAERLSILIKTRQDKCRPNLKTSVP
jgi:D-3-phosphoglycerate dehydrogenase